MGFMDKAKKMAEQAQAKLDEAQKQFNSSQASGGGQGGGPAAEYDKHGRPAAPTPVTPDLGAAPVAVPEAAPAPPVETPGVPPTDTPSAPAQTGPTPDPGAPATPGTPPPTDDRNRPSTEAPKVTHGDPLAG